MVRNTAREIAIHLSYELSFTSKQIDELLDERLTKESFEVLKEEDSIYQEVPNAKQAEYIRRLVKGVNEHAFELDGYIEKYAKGWKYAFRKTRRTAQTTIYNEHYSLPHLLEYSHDVKNKKGGRVLGQTKPHPHIAPIADELVRAYQKEVLDKL